MVSFDNTVLFFIDFNIDWISEPLQSRNSQLRLFSIAQTMNQNWFNNNYASILRRKKNTMHQLYWKVSCTKLGQQCNYSGNAQ